MKKNTGNTCNIQHLPLKIVYYYSQQLTSTVIKVVYILTMPNKAIGTFW